MPLYYNVLVLIIYNKMVDFPQNVKLLSVLSPGIGGWNHQSSLIWPYFDE